MGDACGTRGHRDEAANLAPGVAFFSRPTRCTRRGLSSRMGAGDGRSGWSAVRRSCCGLRSRFGADAQRSLDEPHDVLVGLGGPKGGGEVLPDERARELREQLQVFLVGAVGRCDEEHQVGGAVLGAEVDAWRKARHGECRHEHGPGPAMGNGDAAGNPRRGLFLPGQGIRVESVHFAGAALPGNLFSQVTDHRGPFCSEVPVQSDKLRSDEIGH